MAEEESEWSIILCESVSVYFMFAEQQHCCMFWLCVLVLVNCYVRLWLKFDQYIPNPCTTMSNKLANKDLLIDMSGNSVFRTSFLAYFYFTMCHKIKHFSSLSKISSNLFFLRITLTLIQHKQLTSTSTNNSNMRNGLFLLSVVKGTISVR